MGSLNPKSI